MSPGPRPRRRGRRLIFSLLPAVLLAGLGEGLARLAGPPPDPGPLRSANCAGGARLDPTYGWKLVPGAIVHDPVRRAWAERWHLAAPGQDPHDRVNAYGFRDEPLAWPEPSGQRRVLVMGDSSVYGTGVAMGDRFTDRVERILDPARGADPNQRAVELINGGVPGWTLYPSLRQLAHSLDLGIDAVVVYNVNSDMMFSEGGAPDHEYFNRGWMTPPSSLITRSRLLQWATTSATRWKRGGDHAAPTRRVPLAAYRRALADLVQRCHDEGLGLVFIAPPEPADLLAPRAPLLPGDATEANMLRRRLDEAEERDSLQQGRADYLGAMALAAWDAGVTLIDGPLLFWRSWHADPRRYAEHQAIFVDQIHPSATGHALLATHLAPVLAAILPRLPDHQATRPPPSIPPPVAAPTPTDAPALPALACDERATPATPGERVIAIDTAGLPPGRGFRVYLLRDGLQRSHAAATALCPASDAHVHLTLDTAGLRLTGLVDLDGDGPCFADLAAAGESLGGADDDRVLLRFGPASEAVPWAPPHGLPYGLLRMLVELEQAGVHGPVRVEVDAGLAGHSLLIDSLPEAARAAREAGLDVALVTGDDPAEDHAPDHSAPDHSAPDHSAPDHSGEDERAATVRVSSLAAPRHPTSRRASSPDGPIPPGPCGRSCSRWTAPRRRRGEATTGPRRRREATARAAVKSPRRATVGRCRDAPLS